MALYCQAVSSSELGAGIPLPDFGLHEVAPSWSELSEADRFYVDNTHQDATDFQNQFGSPEKPRLTLPGGTIAAGSVIEIRGGPYGPGRTLQIESQGTASNPVWIRGASSQNKPRIRRRVSLGGSYTIVENLHFDRSRTSVGISPGAHHIAVRDSRFSGSGQNDGFTSVLGAYGEKDNPSHDIVFARNEIHDFGDISDGAPENDYHGIKVSRYCQNIWITGNTISRMGGDSVQVGDSTLDADERCQRVFISQNDFYGNRENGVDIKSAAVVVVSGNTIHDFLPPHSTEAIAVVVHDGADSVWVLDNQVFNNSIGIINTYGTKTWVIGNSIVHSISPDEPDIDSFYGGGVAIHFRGASSGGALLNFLQDYQKGVQVAGGEEYLVAGNQFLGGEQESLFDIMLKTTWLVERVTLTHNHFAEFSARVSSSNYSRQSQLERHSKRVRRETELLNADLVSWFCAPSNTSDIRIPGSVVPESVLEQFRHDTGENLISALFERSGGQPGMDCASD
jgi:hypothetical protein